MDHNNIEELLDYEITKIDRFYHLYNPNEKSLSTYHYNPNSLYRKLEKRGAEEERERARMVNRMRGVSVFRIDGSERGENGYVPIDLVSTVQVADLPLSDCDRVALLMNCSLYEEMMVRGYFKYDRDFRYVVAGVQVNYDWSDDDYEYSLNFSKRLSEYVYARQSCRYNAHTGINMNVKLDRDLYFSSKSNSTGYLEGQLGTMPYVGVGVSSEGIVNSSFGIRLTPEHVIFSAKCLINIFNTYFVNIGTKITNMSQSFRIGLWQNISKFTSFGSEFLFGENGFELLFGFRKNDQQFHFPIKISSNLDIQSILYYGVISGIISLLCSSFILTPMSNTSKQLHSKKEIDDLEQKKKSALKFQRTMTTYVRNHVEKERDTGLVIVRALYGNLDHLDDFSVEVADHKIEDNLIPDYVPHPEIFDVTIPLQYFVHNSTLNMEDNPKSQFMGFYDPCPSSSKHLSIYYRYKLTLRHIIISDTSPLSLPPSNNHKRFP